MPTLVYSGLTYPTPLDPAYADIWGDILNDIFIQMDASNGREQASFQIIYPGNIQYYCFSNIRFPGTIKSITAFTNTGTVTANVKINSTSVTSLNAVAITSSEATTTATGLNTFVAGDDISVTLSSLVDATSLVFNIWMDRTGAGIA